MVLSKTIRPIHFLALGFGSIIGSAWLVVLSDWLRSAGPGGAILAFSVAGLATCSIGFCYAALGRRYPVAGGEVVYAFHAFGPGAGFMAGWFLALMLVAACAFEGLAVATFLEAVVPGISGPTWYRFAGEPVRIGALLLGISGTLFITFVNISGVRPAMYFQVTITTIFLALVLAVLAWGAAHGHLSNTLPLFPTSPRPWWRGSAGIIATSPFWLYGFQSVLQAVEERSAATSVLQVGRFAVLSILAAAAFYIVVILCTALSAPWKQSAADPVAAAAALGSLDGGKWFVKLMLVAAILSVIKTWNGAAFMASRLLMAQARAGLLPTALGLIHPKYGTPWVALTLVGSLNVAGIALGRGAMLPIAETSAMCIGVLFVMVCAAALKMHSADTRDGQEGVRGGYTLILFALFSALFMAGYGMIAPWWEATAPGHLPYQWIILGTWGSLGLFFWMIRST